MLGFAPSPDLPFPRLRPPNLFQRGPVLFTADSRLDNRQEIAASLGLSTDQAWEGNDGFLLFQAWLKWNTAIVDRIVGDYALAAYDSDRKELVLIRDPTGQRPLFYATLTRGVAFSSTPSGLLAAGDPSLDWNFDQLAAGLLDHALNGPSTYYRGINKVPPGAWVKLRRGNAAAKRYWLPSTEPVRNVSSREWVEHFRDNLDAAVQSHMPRTGRLASHLSSGFDSSAVAATAARLLGPDERLLAFTSAPKADFSAPVPRGRIADESGIAAITAAMHGMEHVVVRETGGFLDILRANARFYQEPVRNIVNLGWASAILSRARASGASVLLTGAQGNLTINAGGMNILSEWVRRNELREWWRQARALAARDDVSWRGIAINSFGPYLPKTVWNALHRAFLHAPSLAKFSFVRDEHRRPDVTAISEAVPLRSPADSRLALLQTTDYGLFHHGALAQAGVDVRNPTADRRLIEFSLRLPPELLLDQGVSKPLARQALADRLPPEILQFTKRGWQGADWADHLHANQIDAIIDQVEGNATVRDLLDIGWMRKVAGIWRDEGTASNIPDLVFSHHLPVALSMAVFIAETEGRQREWRTATPPPDGPSPIPGAAADAPDGMG